MPMFKVTVVRRIEWRRTVLVEAPDDLEAMEMAEKTGIPDTGDVDVEFLGDDVEVTDVVPE